MVVHIEISRTAEKDLKKAPSHISAKFYAWTETVEQIGLEHTRKISGYHDEPLKGKRKGQRSIRLSKHYRAIYETNEKIAIIKIIEVNKHEY